MNAPSSPRTPPPERARYPYLSAITTRWGDNDAYGHVNNVIYYAWFDTVVNRYLIEHGVLDITGSAAIGLVVETSCRYFSSIAYPDAVTAGLRVTKLGNASVTYEIGVFRADATIASACGHFTHVYVDRESRRPVPVPDAVRSILKPLS
jgi:acyl-CoA thioester hydrolase